MSLATSREKRSNAGARMSKLIDEEEEDEFYNTAYGGFAEIENDKEFEENEVDHEEDYVDSDFDIDENENQNSDQDMKDQEDEEENKRKRASNKRGVVTKAYKEPIVKAESIKKEADDFKKSKKDTNIPISPSTTEATGKNYFLSFIFQPITIIITFRK
jgi:vacuolar protein sorting-associated protein 72